MKVPLRSSEKPRISGGTRECYGAAIRLGANNAICHSCLLRFGARRVRTPKGVEFKPNSGGTRNLSGTSDSPIPFLDVCDICQKSRNFLWRATYYYTRF